jgi:hypothetical protein
MDEGCARRSPLYQLEMREVRPGLSLTSSQLILIYDHRWGFPCCVWSRLPTCHRHYPGRSNGACSLIPLHRQRPSLCNSQVGSCNCCFGACSAFIHVMACTLAESPSDPFPRAPTASFVLHCRLDCYRVERTSSREGVAPAEVQRLFTAHCYDNYAKVPVSELPTTLPAELGSLFAKLSFS